MTFSSTPGQSQSLPLTSLTKTSGGAVTSADLAPIVALELLLVGPGDGKTANLISGAGTITYAAANPLEPLAAFGMGLLPEGFSAALSWAIPRLKDGFGDKVS